MPIDPMELTFETIEAHERARGGAARRAAIEAGIDVTLIDHNLSLTPAQRLEQHDAMLRLLHAKLTNR